MRQQTARSSNTPDSAPCPSETGWKFANQPATPDCGMPVISAGRPTADPTNDPRTRTRDRNRPSNEEARRNKIARTLEQLLQAADRMELLEGNNGAMQELVLQNWEKLAVLTGNQELARQHGFDSPRIRSSQLRFRQRRRRRRTQAALFQAEAAVLDHYLLTRERSLAAAALGINPPPEASGSVRSGEIDQRE